MNAEDESAWLRSIAARLESHAKELSNNLLPNSPKVDLEQRLESLGWVEAKSKKCDFCRDAPRDLVAVLRAQPKGSFTGSAHYFNVSTSEDTIFRFTRKSFA